MSWMLVFPQTPHALVVRKLRRASGLTVTPAARVTSAMLPIPSWSAWPHAVPSHSLIPATSARDRTMASLTRNPAASSRSSPGVRMVMVSAVPFTLIPSGSSAASRSARGSEPPAPPSVGSVIRSTRRRAVRPAKRPVLSASSNQTPLLGSRPSSRRTCQAGCAAAAGPLGALLSESRTTRAAVEPTYWLGHLVEGRPGDRLRRAAHGGHRDRGVLPAGGKPRGESRLVHPDAATAAVASSGGRAAGRMPKRTAVLLRAGPADQAEAGRFGR